MFKKEKNGKTNINPTKEGDILVFLFWFLLAILIILIVTIILTKARTSIEIENLRIYFHKKIYINDNYKIVFKIKIFNKIPILKFNLDKNRLTLKINKIKNKKEFPKKEESFIKNKIKKEILKNLTGIKINELDLKIKLGTENAFFTSMTIPIISSIIAIILMKKMTNAEKQKYIVEPIYSNQNILEILISGIFEMKMIHIINIIYILTKKEGVKKNERTSNRRPYDYGYE